jgi:putative ABC transport system substrate-binding protein
MKTIIVCLMVALGLAAAQPAAARGIVVIMSADVGPYQEALRGFKDAVSQPIVAEYDMRGDFERGRTILAEIRSQVKPDLILAMGVWALQLVARERIDTPVVFAMVLNPHAVLSGEPGNITGASMNVPADEAIRVLEQLGPQVNRIGVVYNPVTTGYLLERATAAAQSRGLTLVTRTIRSPKEAIAAIKALQQQGVNALWIVPDESVLDPKVIEFALLTSYRAKIPLLGLSERQAEMGAVLSVAFGSSNDIGRQAGELAEAILSGAAVGQLPYTAARNVKLVVNLKAAEKLGMRIPESLLAAADSVIR